MKGLVLTICVAIIAITFVVSAAQPSGDMESCSVEISTIETPETAIAEEIIIEPPEATTEAATMTLETILETAPIITPTYNVNLFVEVQECIITECEKYGINPKIIIAMIEKESRYNPNAIGDNGNSFGLMQIQPRWHTKRMEKLGCTDLLNPIQNVKVGIDYLGELYNRYGDIGKALTAYNTGSYNGTITYYATSVMARANEV